MSLVDAHCHLDGKRFASDRDAVIARAREAGVRWMLAIGTGDGPPDLEAGIRVAQHDAAIFATAGIHPHDAAKADGAAFERLEALTRHPKVVALGEIGLDYHYDFAPRDVQQSVFVRQIGIARSAGLPIVIHTREAWDDTMDLLRQHWASAGVPGMMHCFSEGPERMKQALDLGFYISFTGIVTFPSSADIQASARQVPLDRVLVETDSPYLAPVPYRGKRNEPAYVRETAAFLANLRGIPVDAIEQATTANFFRLFPAAQVGANLGECS